MNNQRFVKGVIIGAVVGGLITMLDRDTRNEVSRKLKSTQNSTTYYVKHPSIAMHDLREGYVKLSSQLSSGVNSTLTMLAQFQDLLDTINREKENQLPYNENK